MGVVFCIKRLLWCDLAVDQYINEHSVSVSVRIHEPSSLPPVLATPVMIMVMENAALNAIKAYLEPGESAVSAPPSTFAISRRHRPATE
jgi:predicted thioesterase